MIGEEERKRQAEEDQKKQREIEEKNRAAIRRMQASLSTRYVTIIKHDQSVLKNEDDLNFLVLRNVSCYCSVSSDHIVLPVKSLDMESFQLHIDDKRLSWIKTCKPWA